jgi:aryl-alcohol dehydrogenase-like predicted oxidoreductase
MEYRELGRTGVEVSRVILGCGNFGGIGSAPEFFGHGESEEAAFAIMDAAWEAGITTFDTADAYGGGRSETSIGKWLRAKGPAVRERIVLSTKVYNPMEEGGDSGLAPMRIHRQLYSSLRRLGVERVEMYLTHETPDPDVPLVDTLAALDELRSAGVVGHVGASNIEPATLRKALSTSQTFEWVQNSYSLLERRDEDELLPLCAAHGLGYTPYSPLAGGWLTGKYRRGEPPPPGSRMTLRPDPYEHLRNDATFDALESFAASAAGRGIEMSTLALGWLLAQPGVTAVIVGPRRPEQLDAAVRALDLELTAGDSAAVAAIF